MKFKTNLNFNSINNFFKKIQQKVIHSKVLLEYLKEVIISFRFIPLSILQFLQPLCGSWIPMIMGVKTLLMAGVVLIRLKLIGLKAPSIH